GQTRGHVRQQLGRRPLRHPPQLHQSGGDGGRAGRGAAGHEAPHPAPRRARGSVSGSCPAMTRWANGGSMTRIGLLVVAYNAATTLGDVLDRIPESFRPRITEILVGDDHSQDDTCNAGLEYQKRTPDLPITVVRHPRNLGYGGNQKAGYRWA